MARENFKRVILFLGIIALLTTVIFLVKQHNGIQVAEYQNRLDAESAEAKLKFRFGENQSLFRAALQMKSAIDAVIENPNDAKILDKEISKSMSCLIATGIDQGLAADSAISLIGEVRDLSIGTDEDRNKKYIKYNAELDGQMLNMEEPSLENCTFSVDK